MHILHVIANLDRSSGGPALAAVELAAAGARAGHQVHIVAGIGGSTVELDAAKNLGVEITFLSLSWPHQWQRLGGLGRVLKNRLAQTDLVHLHSLYLYHVWATGRAAAALGVPYLLRPHGTLAPYLYDRHPLRNRLMGLAFQDRVIRQAAAVHCTSAREAEQVLALHPGLRTEVLPLGIDLAPYRAAPKRNVLDGAIAGLESAPYLLFLGRLHRKKRIDLLIQAFAALKYPSDLKLVIAGPDDGVQKEARALAHNLGVAARVIFPGLLSGEKKLAALAHAHAFVLASETENFGLAVLEALASGTPVVVSDQVDIAPEIEAAGAGLVVPLEQAALTAALQRLLGEAGLRDRLASACRPLAENYSKDRLQLGLDRLYRSLV